MQNPMTIEFIEMNVSYSLSLGGEGWGEGQTSSSTVNVVHTLGARCYNERYRTTSSLPCFLPSLLIRNSGFSCCD